MEARERILAEAERVVLASGPAQLRVTAVARALGMSHANVYRYFKSRRALVEAIAEAHLARARSAVQEAMRGAGPRASAKLEAAAVAMARHKEAQQQSGAHRVVAMILDDAPELAARHLAAQHYRLAAVLEQGTDDGELAVDDPVDTAHAVLDALAAIHHPALQSPGRLEARARRLVRLLLRGLQA